MIYNDEQSEARDRRVDDPQLVCVRPGGQHLLNLGAEVAGALYEGGGLVEAKLV